MPSPTPRPFRSPARHGRAVRRARPALERLEGGLAPAGPDLCWGRQFGTANLDGVGGVAVAPDRVYVVGNTYGTLGAASAGGQDAYLRKYDLDGNALWTRQ